VAAHNIVMRSLEGIRTIIKRLAQTGGVVEHQRVEFIENTFSEWEADSGEGDVVVIEHLTGKLPWQVGVPTLSALCE
jgi:hypothetical protein